MLEQKKSKTIKRIEKICQDECVFLAIPRELSLSKWFDMGGEGNEELEYKNEKELFENFNDFIHQIDQNPSWENQKTKVNFINHGLTRIENRLKELNIITKIDKITNNYPKEQQEQLSNFLLDIDNSWEIYGAVICESKKVAEETLKKINKYDEGDYEWSNDDIIPLDGPGTKKYLIYGFSYDPVIEKIVDNKNVFEAESMYLFDYEQLEDLSIFLEEIKYLDKNDFIQLDNYLIQTNIQKSNKLHDFLKIINDLNVVLDNDESDLDQQYNTNYRYSNAQDQGGQ